MWTFKDCEDEFKKRRKGSKVKSVNRGVKLTLDEIPGESATFVFTMYGTEIVKIKKDLINKDVTYMLDGGTWRNGYTTCKRMYEYTGTNPFDHPVSPTWQLVTNDRLPIGHKWRAPRKYQVGKKRIEVFGYPFTCGMWLDNRQVPLIKVTEEQFKMLNSAQELARKRMVRPWLEAIKIACELARDAEPTKDTHDMTGELVHAIMRDETPDPGLAMAAVIHEITTGKQRYRRWRRQAVEPNMRSVYNDISKRILETTRSLVKYDMVTGYLLDKG